MDFDPNLPKIDDLLSLFTGDTKLLDVRAPIEFAEGAFPGAVNKPLIDDEQRHRIGKTYNDQGQDVAVELGLQLVKGDIKQQRVHQWAEFARKHPDGALYCFRGGMRSKIAQQWLFEHAGIRFPRIVGGYKALRGFLLEQLKENSQIIRPVVIGGRTGTGKTRLLQKLKPHLDLEKLAWHRGSAFGCHATPQPTQIDFENALSIAVLKLRHSGNPWFVTEDESRNIGTRHMPMDFYNSLTRAPLLVLEEPLEARIEVTQAEYVEAALAEYVGIQGQDDGFSAWADYLRNSLYRIRKRLGGVNHQAISLLLERALQAHREQGEISLHREWISKLLTDYYDSMYSYQLQQKQERVEFTGDGNSIVEYLSEHYAITAK